MSAGQDRVERERRSADRSFLPSGWGILIGFALLAAVAIILTVWIQPWEGDEGDNISIVDGIELPGGDDSSADGDVPGTFDEAP